MRFLALFLAATALLAEAPAPLSPVERLAETALAFAQLEGEKLSGEHKFKLAQPPRVPLVRKGILSFEASHLSKQEPVGRFFVVVTMKLNGEKIGMTRVDLDGSWVGTLLRAKSDLARKVELTQELVDSTPFEGLPPEGALTEIPASMRLARAVASGKIITRGDLEALPLIQSGDRVRLTATHEYLTISIDTTARSRGAMGERVRLEAPGSRRAVTAIITGPGEARTLN